MSQEDIRKHLDKCHELGKYFIRKTITIKEKEGTRVIEQFVRGASDQNFINPVNKDFDDEMFRQKSEADFKHSLMILYNITKTELKDRGFKDRLISIEDEQDFFDDEYKLFGWIMDELRFLEIDVPFDRHFKRTILKDDIPLGQKILSQDQAEKYTLEEEE